MLKQRCVVLLLGAPKKCVTPDKPFKKKPQPPPLGQAQQDQRIDYGSLDGRHSRKNNPWWKAQTSSQVVVTRVLTQGIQGFPVL